MIRQSTVFVFNGIVMKFLSRSYFVRSPFSARLYNTVTMLTIINFTIIISEVFTTVSVGVKLQRNVENFGNKVWNFTIRCHGSVIRGRVRPEATLVTLFDARIREDFSCHSRRCEGFNARGTLPGSSRRVFRFILASITFGD